jgi:cyclase
MHTVPESRHFTIEPLADGVWAAIHRAGGWATANAGIIDLGDATLLFDTFLTADAARDLAAAAVALTGRPASSVALSHFHNDHIRGSEVFAGVPLVASEATRRLIDTLGREELASDLEHAEAGRAMSVALADDDDPRRRASSATFTPYWEGLIASAPHATLRLPDVTWSGSFDFVGTRRTARLISIGAAHTPDDAVLVLPDDRVVFCGDLLFVRSHPWLAGGDPEGWLRALATLEEYAPAHFVPGHGPVGTSGDVAAMAAHIRGLQDTAERLHAALTPEADVEALLPSDASAEWEYAFPFYRANVRFLLGRL